MLIENSKLKFIFLMLNIYIYVFSELFITFSYWDEGLAIFFVMYILSRGVKNKFHFRISSSTLVSFILVMFILFCGIISNLIYRYQGLDAIVADIIIMFKFLITLFGSYYFFANMDIYRYKINFRKNIKFIVLALFLILMFMLGFHLYLFDQIVLTQVPLFYNQPTYLAAVSVFLLACLVLCMKFGYNINFYIALCIFMAIITGKMKAIMFIFIFISLYFIIIKLNKRLKLSHLLLLIPIGIYISWDKIYYFFFSTSDIKARSALLLASMRIAMDKFPFGSGFGTFGSYYSGEYYSPVYKEYEIHKVWGLSENYHSFISDSFWPMLLGQFGFFGLIAYTGLVILILKKIFRIYKIDKIYYLTALLLIVYLLISSTAESAFNNYFSVYYSMLLGLILSIYNIAKGQGNHGENKCQS